MSLYVVGDIQGCYRELMMLLDKVGFSYQYDTLWCVGDIVARGPDSLQALEFFENSPQHAIRTVLGNHDLNLLGILLGFREANPKDKLDGILQSRRKLDWIDWLRQQPLLHTEAQHNLAISHAGIYPWWSLNQAKSAALELEHTLQAEDFAIFIKQMFGNKPDNWSSSLTGFDRYRFIVNAFTRMRFCHTSGELNFSEKAHPEQQADKNLRPWFEFYQQPTRVAFGHWAALMGDTNNSDVVGLDTGCVWGNHMTLWDVDKNVCYQQSAVNR
ncbi:MAG: symmetrical bis(5'-nucleosyl)-tetraphosphatase [Pseudomonadota bacterium]